MAIDPDTGYTYIQYESHSVTFYLILSASARPLSTDIDRHEPRDEPLEGVRVVPLVWLTSASVIMADVIVTAHVSESSSQRM